MYSVHSALFSSVKKIAKLFISVNPNLSNAQMLMDFSFGIHRCRLPVPNMGMHKCQNSRKPPDDPDLAGKPAISGSRSRGLHWRRDRRVLTGCGRRCGPSTGERGWTAGRFSRVPCPPLKLEAPPTSPIRGLQLRVTQALLRHRMGCVSPRRRLCSTLSRTLLITSIMDG